MQESSGGGKDQGAFRVLREARVSGMQTVTRREVSGEAGRWTEAGTGLGIPFKGFRGSRKLSVLSFILLLLFSC